MLDNKFLWLLITFVWMSGLFAIVLTVAYILQERRRHGQDSGYTSGYTWGVPRILLPLYGSLALFCLGLAMQAYAAQRSSSLWITLVWALLALSCAGRALRVLLTGFRQGWNVRLNAQLIQVDSANFASGIRLPIWLIFTALLLLINLYFLTTMGIAQVNAGQLFGAVRKENSASTPTLNEEAGRLPASTTQAIARATVGVAAALESQPTLSATAVEAAVEATATPMPTEVATEIPSETVTAVAEPLARPTIRPLVGALVRPAVMPEAAPENTPIPATQSVTISVVVQSRRGANVRRAPELTAEIITVLNNATVVPVLGRTRNNAWFYVQLADGESGWISSTVVKASNVISLAPVMDGE